MLVTPVTKITSREDYSGRVVRSRSSNGSRSCKLVVFVVVGIVVVVGVIVVVVGVIVVGGGVSK